MSGEEPPDGSFVRFEPPDIVFAGFVGVVDVDLTRRMNAELWRLAHDKPRIFLLLDQSRIVSVTPEARKIALEITKKLPLVGAASFGASFPVRVMVTLLARADAFFRKETGPAVHFFGSEAEARAWIEERRRALLK